MASNNESNRYLEILKWFVGTVVLGTAGIIINYQIQKTELEIKRLEADAGFLNVVTKNLENRGDTTELGYLEFIQTFITTHQIKVEVKARIRELETHINQTVTAEAKAASDKKVQNLMGALSSDQIEQFRQIEKEEKTTEGEQQSINELIQKESEVADQETPIHSNSISSISRAKELTTPLSVKTKKETYTRIGKPITRWCKKGYYVEFGNTLRLGINELTSGSIIFNLKDIEGDKRNNPQFIENNAEVELSEGEIYTLTYDSYRYEISLDYIGSAGKNPFTKAAYITVTTYKK
ncbi:MAG: hypothetical protein AAFW89_02955 [Bacteroidota bacterium]